MTTVTGSATVGGVSYPVSAGIALPSAPSPSASACLLGVYDPANDWPSSWSGEQAFQSAGVPVRVATYYVQCNGGFPANLASLAWQHGQLIPFIELEPWFTTTTWPAFTDIAAGKYDASWLQPMAQAVVAYGHPCMLTYAHEMNGSWYPWGNGGAEGVTPAQWVASWRHVVDTMNAVPGAKDLITWVWAPNNADVGSVADYYPADAYVGVAGFDAYLQDQSATYESFMAQTVAEIRSVTSKPVWLAETGIEPAGTGRAARITSFVSDLKNAGLEGLMWFNQGTDALTTAEISTLASAVNAWNAG